MKNTLFTLMLLISSLATASEYNYEFTPLIGYNIAEGNLDLKNTPLVGAELQHNDIDSSIKPELSFLYADSVKSKNLPISSKTKMYRFALNGVYELEESGSLTPFLKAGVGYEKMSNHINQNENGIFIDAGAGVKFKLAEAIALKAETIYSLKHNKNTSGDRMGDSNLAVLAGFVFSFGKTNHSPVESDDDNDGVVNSLDKCPTTPAGGLVDFDGCCLDNDHDGVKNSFDKCPNSPKGSKVNAEGCPLDDDKDGVINSLDKCPTTPLGDSVNEQGCPLDGDDDKDGVLNSLDKCPTTPMGTVVNDQGCERIVNLHVNFKNNSYKVDTASLVRVQKFAKFLIDFPQYSATITGHTNSIGSAASNQRLSENRANAVRTLIINEGVDANRVASQGKGETSPVADNNTQDGLAKNRRIEATLSR